MTAKEKAKQLFDKFFNEQIQIDWTDDQGILKNAENNYLKNKDEQDIYWQKLAIHSALIAVDELIELSSVLNKWDMIYYKEVKQEIEKL